MKVIRVWLLVGLVAVAMIGLLWATEVLTNDRAQEVGRMAFRRRVMRRSAPARSVSVWRQYQRSASAAMISGYL